MAYIRCTTNPDKLEVINTGKCVSFNFPNIVEGFRLEHDSIRKCINWYLNSTVGVYSEIGFFIDRRDLEINLSFGFKGFDKIELNNFTISFSTWESFVFNYINTEIKHNKWRRLKYFLTNRI